MKYSIGANQVNTFACSGKEKCLVSPSQITTNYLKNMKIGSLIRSISPPSKEPDTAYSVLTAPWMREEEQDLVAV